MYVPGAPYFVFKNEVGQGFRTTASEYRAIISQTKSSEGVCVLLPLRPEEELTFMQSCQNAGEWLTVCMNLYKTMFSPVTVSFQTMLVCFI